MIINVKSEDGKKKVVHAFLLAMQHISDNQKKISLSKANSEPSPSKIKEGPFKLQLKKDRCFEPHTFDDVPSMIPDMKTQSLENNRKSNKSLRSHHKRS